MHRHNLSICRPLTADEIAIQGLLGKTTRPKLQAIYLGPPKGRGVITKQRIEKGAYVCEYRTYRVYPVGSELCVQLAAEYRSNFEGYYVIETAYRIPNVGRLCFDATRRYRDVGRLINHSSTTPNLKLSRPLHVRGKWRLALLALTDIKPDEELNCNYGVRSLMWMKKRARNITASKGQEGTGEEEGSVKTGRGDEGGEGTEEEKREERNLTAGRGEEEGKGAEEEKREEEGSHIAGGGELGKEKEENR